MQGRGGSKHSTYNKDLRVACKVGVDLNIVHTTRCLRVACKVGVDLNIVHTTRISG